MKAQLKALQQEKDRLEIELQQAIEKTRVNSRITLPDGESATIAEAQQQATEDFHEELLEAHERRGRTRTTPGRRVRAPKVGRM